MPSINPFGAAEVPATETVAGIVELATQAEVDAGTDAVRAITPATLAAKPAAGGAGLVFLSEVVASGAATADLETTFDSTFDAYLIVGVGVVPTSNGADILCRMKVGGAYDAGNNYQSHAHAMKSSSTVYAARASSSTSALVIADDVSSAASKDSQFTLIVSDPDSTTKQKKAQWHGIASTSANISESTVGGGVNTADTVLTGIRFLASTGNITGRFRLYGITNS